MLSNSYRRLVLGITFCVAISGCTNIDFKEPISEFGVAMSTSAIVLNNYYSNLNAAERKVYLTRIKYSDEEDIGVIAQDGSRTGLINYYPPEWIKAKTDTITLLSLFGSRLAALAGSNDPEQFSSGVLVLGENLNTLGAQIGKIAKTENQIKFSGDISKIISILGEMYQDHKRDVAITDAVNQGHIAVGHALDFLESDLPTINTLQETGRWQSLAAPTVYYNNNLVGKNAPLAQKEKILGEIESNAQALELASSQDPARVIAAVREALNSIVAYAKDPGGPDKLVKLNSSIERFNNIVGPLVISINNIRR